MRMSMPGDGASLGRSMLRPYKGEQLDGEKHR